MNDIVTDVLIIGAGLTGAMIAAQLAEQGARVAVVDAQQVGQSASRRALGIATPDPSAAHFDETSRGFELLNRIAAKHGIPLQSTNVLHLATTPEHETALRDLAALHAPRLEWTTLADVLPPSFTSGLIAHDGALVDMDYLIVRLLMQPGIQLRQYAEVTRLEARDGVTYALCSNVTAVARHVILATNAYAGLLSTYLADSVQGARGAVWVSCPLRESAAKFPSPILVDGGSLMLAPGKDARLRAAAWQWNGSAPGADPSGQLTRFLKRLDPALTEQTEQWMTGVTTVTSDGAPLIGRLVGDSNVWHAIGLGPYGLAWATIAADKIAGLVLAR
jgi:glycine/D-amino acid oxidase-like deaminating enzyme